LFLDEVGEIPLDLQGKLLRVLQEGEFERVGEDLTRKVDVRVIAATNRQLQQEIEAGRFREDLYYRLNVFPLEIPPLRERIEDIAPIATLFLAQACRKLGIPEVKFKQRHIVQLQDYPWPGNARELRNVIERAVINSRSGSLRIDLPLTGEAETPLPGPSAPFPVRTGGTTAIILSDAEMKQQERRNLLAALTAADWKVSGPGGAAELLGVKPTTLASRIKSMGIDKPR
jgi:transcriptional regulator with GAF, ATPase, and Fis domain